MANTSPAPTRRLPVCPRNRYGYEYFADDALIDSYHNCMRMLDHFLENLITSTRRWACTTYHRRRLREPRRGFRRAWHATCTATPSTRRPEDTPLIHAPGRFEGGERVGGLSNQTDIVPNRAGDLGYNGGGWALTGLLAPPSLPGDRTLRFKLHHRPQVPGEHKGTEKYIYHYDNSPTRSSTSRGPHGEQQPRGRTQRGGVKTGCEGTPRWHSGVNAGTAAVATVRLLSLTGG